MNIAPLYQTKYKELVKKMGQSKKSYDFFFIFQITTNITGFIAAYILAASGLVNENMTLVTISTLMIVVLVFFSLIVNNARKEVDRLKHGRKRASRSKLLKTAAWLSAFPELSKEIDKDISCFTNDDYSNLKKVYKSLKRKAVEDKIRSGASSAGANDNLSTPSS